MLFSATEHGSAARHALQLHINTAAVRRDQTAKVSIITVTFVTSLNINSLLPSLRRRCFHLHLSVCLSVNKITKKTTDQISVIFCGMVGLGCNPWTNQILSDRDRWSGSLKVKKSKSCLGIITLFKAVVESRDTN